jgi:hypothetical protein
MDYLNLRRQVAELRDLADISRGAAARVAAADGVEWCSVAAERFRSALRAEAALTRHCAELLDAAAQAMAAHAQTVEQVFR